MRRYGAHQLDRPKKIGGELVGDLFIAEFLRRPEEAVPGVADDDIDPAEVGESLFHDAADSRKVGHVEMLKPQEIAVFCLEVAHGIYLSYRAGDAVAALKKPLGHEAAEAAVHAGNQPG